MQYLKSFVRLDGWSVGRKNGIHRNIKLKITYEQEKK